MVCLCLRTSFRKFNQLKKRGIQLERYYILKQTKDQPIISILKLSATESEILTVDKLTLGKVHRFADRTFLTQDQLEFLQKFSIGNLSIKNRNKKKSRKNENLLTSLNVCDLKARDVSLVWNPNDEEIVSEIMINDKNYESLLILSKMKAEPENTIDLPQHHNNPEDNSLPASEFTAGEDDSISIKSEPLSSVEDPDECIDYMDDNDACEPNPYSIERDDIIMKNLSAVFHPKLIVGEVINNIPNQNGVVERVEPKIKTETDLTVAVESDLVEHNDGRCQKCNCALTDSNNSMFCGICSSFFQVMEENRKFSFSSMNSSSGSDCNTRTRGRGRPPVDIEPEPISYQNPREKNNWASRRSRRKRRMQELELNKEYNYLIQKNFILQSVLRQKKQKRDKYRNACLNLLQRWKKDPCINLSVNFADLLSNLTYLRDNN